MTERVKERAPGKPPMQELYPGEAVLQSITSGGIYTVLGLQVPGNTQAVALHDTIRVLTRKPPFVQPGSACSIREAQK